MKDHTPNKWASGHYQNVLTIELTDQEIEKITGLKLTTGNEIGLGTWVAVGGTLSDQEQYEIIKHTESRTPTHFAVRVDSAQNIKQIYKKLQSELGLPSKDIQWKRDELQDT